MLIAVLMAVIIALIVAAAVLTAQVYITNRSISAVLEETGALPEFDGDLVDLVDSYFAIYYYTELPAREVLAQQTLAAYDEFCRGKINETDSDEVTLAVIDCYIYAIGDSYAFYRTPTETDDFYTDMSGSFVGIGVSVLSDTLEGTITVDSVEPDSPAQKAGVLPGDLIVAVDGTRIEDVGVEALIDLVRGEVGTEVTVTVRRGETEIPLTAVREQITETTVALSYIEEGSIAYIRIKGFKSNTAAQFIDAIQKVEASEAKAIIFDLCGNPGGSLDTTVQMLSYLVPDGTRIASFSAFLGPIDASSGESSEYEKTDHVLNLPVAVTVNRYSASASELFTQALKDYTEMGILDAAVLGEVTYKKGVMQFTIPFTNGGTLTLTTALYNPPSGNNFNGVGVMPDIPVAEGEDVTAAAIAYLKTKIN